MNKKELATVVVLILLIPVWLMLDANFVKPMFPEPPAPLATATPVPQATPSAALPDITPSEAVLEAPAEIPPIAEPLIEARTLELTNAVFNVRITNLGAGIRDVVVKNYRETLADDSPVHMDFSEAPALVYDSPGLNAAAAFAMELSDDGQAVNLSRDLPNGLRFTREIRMDGDTYVLRVKDTWKNATDNDLPVPELPLWLGKMFPRPEATQKFGPFLGVDARHTGRVKHYVKDITKGVNKASGVWEQTLPLPIDWIGVKNKFFTQVLSFEKSDWPGAQSFVMRATKGEGDVRIGMVQAASRLGASVVPPGRVMERRYSYYAGPISMDNLRKLGLEQEEVIDFRLWRVFVPVGKLLMNGLTGLERVTGNWGIAIILLTFVVRMLFWPLTQKGAENMKRMSQYGPQMKELREKYKSNPQKLNQAMGEFYKEHKINPMAGCLPMFVQIPVFIALYGTLRVAVELRFADFLWIKDLSEQEDILRLFGYPLNILPLTMGATMIWQQRMTPGTMDDQQRKIMMMMPVVFLFISYNMPAGLLLYWTASNLISIYQSWHTKRREAKKAPPAAVAAPAAPSPLTRKAPKSGKKR